MSTEPSPQLIADIEQCGLGYWDDNVAEIVQYQYEPGALKQLAYENGCDPTDLD